MVSGSAHRSRWCARAASAEAGAYRDRTEPGAGSGAIFVLATLIIPQSLAGTFQAKRLYTLNGALRWLRLRKSASGYPPTRAAQEPTVIVIVTDTSAALPVDAIQHYQLVRVPIYLYFGSELYRDGFDITPQQVFDRMARGAMPSTSEPATQDFEQAYASLFAAAPDIQILSIHVSSLLSGTLASARQAASKMVGCNIHLFDSQSCTLGHGMMVLEAAQMVEQGAALPEIIARLEHIRASIQFYIALESLGPLAQSGRLWHLSRMAGSLGKMKPIIRVRNGILEGFEKQPTIQKSIERLCEVAMSAPQGATLGITHSARPDDAATLAEALTGAIKPSSLLIPELGPAFSFYFSSGALGVAWY
jgi:DegV family protein with EDD domain